MAEIRREIVERVLARRGRLHLFDSLDPASAQLAPAARSAEGRSPRGRSPSSGERLPIVGIGTAVIFDYQNDPAKQRRAGR